MTRPIVIMFGGPNGSGKSTLADEIKAAGYSLDNYINADEIERGVQGGTREERSRKAMAEAERRRRSHMARRESFSFETVMSHPSKIETLRTARHLGYEVVLYFVATDNVEINVERVKARVAAGGHDVDEARIRARYQRALHLVFSAVRVAERSVIFDNTSSEKAATGARRPLRPIAEFASDGVLVETVRMAADPPDWVKALVSAIDAEARSLN